MGYICEEIDGQCVPDELKNQMIVALVSNIHVIQAPDHNKDPNFNQNFTQDQIQASTLLAIKALSLSVKFAH